MLKRHVQGGGRCHLQRTGHGEDPHRDAEQVSTRSRCRARPREIEQVGILQDAEQVRTPHRDADPHRADLHVSLPRITVVLEVGKYIFGSPPVDV